MFSLLLRAPLAGILAYFFVLVSEGFLLKNSGFGLGGTFILLPAFIEELSKIGFARKITPEKEKIVFALFLLCLAFGIAEAFFSTEKTISTFIRLPAAHFAFSFFGFLIAKISLKKFIDVSDPTFLIPWVAMSTLLHWLFNLIILNFYQPF